MKVKLTKDLPVAPRHGMTKGRELEVVQINPGRKSQGLPPKRGENDDSYWVMGDAGEKVKLLKNEYKVIHNKE